MGDLSLDANDSLSRSPLVMGDGREVVGARGSLSRSPLMLGDGELRRRLRLRLPLLVMGDGREVVGACGSLSRAPLMLGDVMMPWRAPPSSETPIAVGMDV